MPKPVRPTPPLKWHGGKHYLASKIVAMMPPHLHYVEPYFGGGSVLLAKNPKGVSEVVNDLNRYLTTFWNVMKYDNTFEQFRRVVEATPFSEHEWSAAKGMEVVGFNGDVPDEGRIMRAIAFFIRCRQSLAGRMDTFAPLSRTRVRRGMNEQASAWLNVVEGLPAVHARLKRVVILNRDALDVIRQQDGPETLYYLDPPYLHETRTTTGEYEHEMTEDQHGELLETIGGVGFEGKFLLSGYRSDLYDDWAKGCGWNRKDFDLPNNSAGGGTKRRMTECVWYNYDLPEK